MFFLLAACGKDKTEAARQDAPVKSAAVNAVARDWKEIYLEELLAAQEYCAAADWENHNRDGKYPLDLFAAQLVDINFDGTPELFLFGAGAGASQDMRIFTIKDNSAHMIFHGWGNMDEIYLYRKLGSDIQVFVFESANGNEEYYGGAWYMTGADTKMDMSLAEAAKFGEFSERHVYGDGGEYFNSTYTYNGREVRENDYRQLLDAMFADYIELPHMPSGIIWNTSWEDGGYSIKPLTASQITPFLDNFDEEDGMGDPGY